jgi:hypothetical protein
MIARYCDELSQKSSIHISLFVLNYYSFRIGTEKYEDQTIFFKYGGFILREDAWPVQPRRQLLETSYLAQYFE